MSQYFDNASRNLFMEPKVTQHGSHMVMTDVTPPTKVKHINIDTRYRDDYDPSKVADYSITLPERINDVKSIQVVNAEIPMTFYNISSALGNNVLHLTLGEFVAVVIIPDNQYTEESLVTAINDQIASTSAAVFQKIIYSIENHRSVFTNTSSVECEVAFDVTTQGSVDLQNATYKLGWLLGYRSQVYIVRSMANRTSDAFVDLYGPRYLYLVVDEFKNGNPHSFTSLLQESAVNGSQILARFAMNSKSYPYGVMFPVRGSYIDSDVRKYTGTVNLQRFNIKLVNERGVPLNLNGMDFSFCMVATHE
jgi:hypothetical protein